MSLEERCPVLFCECKVTNKYSHTQLLLIMFDRVLLFYQQKTQCSKKNLWFLRFPLIRTKIASNYLVIGLVARVFFLFVGLRYHCICMKV